MKVLEAVEISLGWKDLDNRVVHPRPTIKRTKGVPHVGAILKHVAVATGMMQASEIDLEEMPLRMALGVAWEEMAAGLYGNDDGFRWQPGELIRDGIAGNPDGETKELKPRGKVVQIEEFKYTHLSCRNRTIADMWLYLSQVQAYAAMHKDQPLRGRFHIMHANGDYSRPFRERYMRWVVEWTREEVDSCWRMIVSHKDKIEVEA